MSLKILTVLAKIIEEIINFSMIYFIIGIVWIVYELVLYGQTFPNNRDSVIAIFITLVVLFLFKKFKPSSLPFSIEINIEK